MVAMGLAIFLMGLKIYRRQGPLGSPFTRVAQVFVAAARKWHVEKEAGEGRGSDMYYNGEDEQRTAGGRCLVHTPQFRYVGLSISFSGLEGGLSRASVEDGSASMARE